MKALTLKEPWAGMVLSGMKPIETRKWKTTYRGDILITVSKRPKTPMSGLAICVVELYDCRTMELKDEKGACCQIYHKANSWFLRNVRYIKPFPIKGKLSLWNFEGKIEFVNDSLRLV